jgi:hypothetical protein
VSFRLDRGDEIDVRHWLARDPSGGGSRSGSVVGRSIFAPIENFKPFHYYETDEHGRTWRHATEDVGLRCGPIVVTTKKPHYSEREDDGEDLLRMSERDRFIANVWWALKAQHRETLDLCYSGYRPVQGLSEFGELGPLVSETRSGRVLVARACTHAGRTVTILEALIELSSRMERDRKKLSGKRPTESDKTLFAEISTEADRRLSSACLEYTKKADAERKAETARMERAVA